MTILYYLLILIIRLVEIQTISQFTQTFLGFLFKEQLFHILFPFHFRFLFLKEKPQKLRERLACLLLLTSVNAVLLKMF